MTSNTGDELFFDANGQRMRAVIPEGGGGTNRGVRKPSLKHPETNSEFTFIFQPSIFKGYLVSSGGVVFCTFVEIQT